MPSRISGRKFETMCAHDLCDLPVHVATRSTRMSGNMAGVTGRDAYGYSPVIQGKSTGEA